MSGRGGGGPGWGGAGGGGNVPAEGPRDPGGFGQAQGPASAAPPFRARNRHTGACAPLRGPPLPAPARRNNKAESASKSSRKAYKVSQHRTHFLGSPEEAILGGFFGGPQHFADVPQTRPLLVPQL